jgi:hypothetical protein
MTTGAMPQAFNRKKASKTAHFEFPPAAMHMAQAVQECCSINAPLTNIV